MTSTTHDASTARQYITDAIEEARGYGDDLHDALNEAIDNLCIYYADVIGIWSDIPALQPEDAEPSTDIIALMSVCIYEWAHGEFWQDVAE